MKYVLIFLFLTDSIFNFQYNTYQSNQNWSNNIPQQYSYDCLNYYVKDHRNSSKLVVQWMFYCFRPLLTSTIRSSVLTSEHGQNYTFLELNMLNISSEQLYHWSAPIDLIEQYEVYLITKNTSLTNTKFYNCTSLWFGDRCQYSFDIEKTFLSFIHIVDGMFEEKELRISSNDSSIIWSNLSCYIHIPCNRGGPYPACLDWREICDGKVDCTNEGIDEENCDQLEINECAMNEYRCQNGQCIPQDFLWDNLLNPECLDQTDEFVLDVDSRYCLTDPTFRCEEIICRQSIIRNIVCGDGGCVHDRCTNKRDLILKRAMLEATFNITKKCRDSMAYRTDLVSSIFVWNITEHCPKLFQFPEIPVLYGHVKLLYSNLPSKVNMYDFDLPEYVCYDDRLCAFSSTIEFDNYPACRHLKQVILKYDLISSWTELIIELRRTFSRCSIVINGYCHHNSSLYACRSPTKKCISKHRLVDGFQDCYSGDDEKYSHSCSLNNSRNRFSCDHRCISPIQINDQKENCYGGIDEMSFFEIEFRRKLSFQTICDGFVDLQSPQLIDGINHTDETECYQWPCDNIYTRCDGIWNCFNGADELNCSSSICSAETHACVSLANYSLICLPLKRVADGIVDCLGASDERQLCRMWKPGDKTRRFWCYNDTKCVANHDLCNRYSECMYHDDERFCTSFYDLCYPFSESIRTDVDNVLCNLTDDNRRTFIPFSLKASRVYPNQILEYNTTISSPIVENVNSFDKRKHIIFSKKNISWIWRCNRGLAVQVSLIDKKPEYRCLCPPSYYGDLCQYQNQRVSLTLQVKVVAEWRTIFAIVVRLIDSLNQIVNSFEQFDYLSIRDCNTKFNFYLLYMDRPKNHSSNYSIQIDIFNKHTFTYRASWHYPIEHLFLPINRLAIQIIIPLVTRKQCSLECGTHGQCIQYENTNTSFCHCDPGWSGFQCQHSHACHCASDALCSAPSICLCSLQKFGPRCYLRKASCPESYCQNNGICVPADEHNVYDQFSCICTDGFTGKQCEIKHSEIYIQLNHQIQSSFVSIHFLDFLSNLNDTYIQTTVVKRIGLYQNSIQIYQNAPFNIIFIETMSIYYLAYLQENRTRSATINIDILSKNRCLLIDQLFNKTFLEWKLIRRIKFYHQPCQERSDLACFYDDTLMCLCNLHQHANCFQYDHNTNYTCKDTNYCNNAGQCFQDHPQCATTTICFCDECFYGSRCQLSTKGIGLSLDLMLGYHILPKIKFSQQPFIIHLTTSVAIFIASIGFVSNILTVLTLHGNKMLGTGCCVYIVISSWISLLIMSFFLFKTLFLILSHMGFIGHRSYLLIHCISVDFILRMFLHMTDWLNSSVAIERTITVLLGSKFDKKKSKYISSRVCLGILLFSLITSIHDPIYRYLIDDEDEQRIWCVTKYPSHIQIINSTLYVFHLLMPFIINSVSVILIILITTRRRFNLQKKQSITVHLHQQFQHHGHLLVSSIVLVLLALPRLIISFYTDCLKPTRNPWLFVFAYFISFIPVVTPFFIYILPSTEFRKHFFQTFTIWTM